MLSRRVSLFSAVAALALPAIAAAQAHKLKVVAPDGSPIAFANVVIQGGITQITDVNGEVSLGNGTAKTLTVDVYRIGFRRWFGKLDVPDTAAILKIPLAPIAQRLATVTVSGESTRDTPLAHTGFYDRWLMRQKGVLSAEFIGPEELDFRHPDLITNVLYGRNGVVMTQACVQRAGRGGSCRRGLIAIKPGCGAMAIVIDGQQQGPSADINMLLDANDVAAIEIYARGGNMPVNFQFQDIACGVIAFWTGSRQ